jgi:hypothetical protein
LKFSGYIEGFYGRIFTWDERFNMAKNVFAKKMNAYLYAPKEDKFHRILWKEEYNADEREKFEEIIDFANGLDQREFIPAIAPGLSYNYDKSDYEYLKRKIRLFADLGAKSFALTMDDIPCEDRLGKLHGELLKKIRNDFPDIKTLFCPTVYATDLIEENSLCYLNDLRENIPEDVLLLWTGDSTISKRIDKKSLETATQTFGKNLLIWDNFYCTDYAPNRIFIGNYENRDRDFCEKECGGVLINGTGLPITDEIIMEIFDAWLERKNWTDDDIKRLLLSFGVPEKLLDYLPVMSSPYRQDYKLPTDLSAGDFFIEIIAKWQSPLKIEWYNALHAIFTQIRILSAKKPLSEEWYGMRYLR